MTFDPEKHHRQSIRKKGYDYSQPGMVFVTICTQSRVCLFGDVIDKEMVLNEAGRMIEKWVHILNEKYTDIRCENFIVMPNHVHVVIQITVGADRCVCPHDEGNIPRPNETDQSESGETDQSDFKRGKHIGLPLSRVIQWFKTMTTNEYIRNIKSGYWHSLDGRLWQRNYYEHIIRNEKDLNRIRKYIISNPVAWDANLDNPASKNI